MRSSGHLDTMDRGVHHGQTSREILDEKKIVTSLGKISWNLRNGDGSKPCTPSVHIKIAGKWMFIPLKMVLINRYWSIPKWSGWTFLGGPAVCGAVWFLTSQDMQRLGILNQTMGRWKEWESSGRKRRRIGHEHCHCQWRFYQNSNQNKKKVMWHHNIHMREAKRCLSMPTTVMLRPGPGPFFHPVEG